MRLAFALVAAVVPLWALPPAAAVDEAAPYKLTSGPHKVQEHAAVTLRDEQRAKDVPLNIYAPDAGGPYPVILFSHGAGGNRKAFGPLARHWASHGYISIHPSHADASKPGVDRGAGAIYSNLSNPKTWENRARDVSFILDSLPEIARRVPALKDRMDARLIGVAGHSYGAFTAMLLGGTTVDVPGGAQGASFADPRVKAVLVVSGQGTGQQGLTQRSWEKVTLPMMTMTGSRDRGARGQGPEWKAEPFQFSPAGSKYHVFIEGANHFSFGGTLPARRPGGLLGGGRGLALAGNAGAFDAVKVSTTAYWDAFLKEDGKAKAYLDSDALSEWSKQAVKVSRK